MSQQGTSPQNHPSLCASSIAFSILSIDSMFASVSSCLCWWNKIANFVSKLRNCSLKAVNWTKNMRTIILFMLGWERNLLSLLLFYKKNPKCKNQNCNINFKSKDIEQLKKFENCVWNGKRGKEEKKSFFSILTLSDAAVVLERQKEHVLSTDGEIALKSAKS